MLGVVCVGRIRWCVGLGYLCPKIWIGVLTQDLEQLLVVVKLMADLVAIPSLALVFVSLAIFSLKFGLRY